MSCAPPIPTLSVGQKIRDRRRHLKLSQLRLAHRARLALGTISGVERGLTISEASIRKLARALGVPSEDLVPPDPTPRPGGESSSPTRSSLRPRP